MPLMNFSTEKQILLKKFILILPIVIFVSAFAFLTFSQVYSQIYTLEPQSDSLSSLQSNLSNGKEYLQISIINPETTVYQKKNTTSLYNLIVENTGNIPAIFSLEVTGIEKSYIETSEPILLRPGEVGTFYYKIFLPDNIDSCRLFLKISAESQSGIKREKKFIVLLNSMENEGITDNEEKNITINLVNLEKGDIESGNLFLQKLNNNLEYSNISLYIIFSAIVFGIFSAYFVKRLFVKENVFKIYSESGYKKRAAEMLKVRIKREMGRERI